MTKLENLVSLDLSNNPVAEEEAYRKSMLEKFPKLEVLDGMDRTGQEVLSEEDEEGDFAEGGEEELRGLLGEEAEGEEDWNEEAEEDGEESDDEEKVLGKRKNNNGTKSPDSKRFK